MSAENLTWSYAVRLDAFDAASGFVPASWGPACLTCGGGGVTNTLIPVTFNVNATTVWGENIYLTGSVPALQNWSAKGALLLSNPNYPIWTITMNLPADTPIRYKYVRIHNGAVTWESDPNNSFTTPASGTCLINDTWR